MLTARHWKWAGLALAVNLQGSPAAAVIDCATEFELGSSQDIVFACELSGVGTTRLVEPDGSENPCFPAETLRCWRSSGPSGPQGATGSTGPAGPQGAPGPAGSPGPAGPQGAQGPTGSPGPAGPQGAQGPTGSPGPAGPQGAQGPQGPSGAEGPLGSQGDPGTSCWDLDANGTCDLLAEDTDSDGRCTGADCTGPEGAVGPQGPSGATGPGGPAGETGGVGPQGPQGSAGPAGPTGPQGQTGDAGAPGPQGAPGPPGPQGPSGLACWDLNGNGQCELSSEDVDADKACTAADCAGDPGPAGAQGPTGSTGPSGPQGEPGGLTGYVLVENNVDVHAGPADVVINVFCPGSKVALGGGGSHVGDSASNTYMMRSTPITSSGVAYGWLVHWRTPSGGAASSSNHRAYVICADVTW